MLRPHAQTALGWSSAETLPTLSVSQLQICPCDAGLAACSESCSSEVSCSCLRRSFSSPRSAVCCRSTSLHTMSLLSIPRSGSGNKRNSARLDLLSLMINSPEARPSTSDSPRDSLSPISDSGKIGLQERGRTLSRKGLDLSRDVDSRTECKL